MSMIVQMRRAAPGRLEEVAAAGTTPFDFVCPIDDADPAFKDGSIVDLDKAWHAIHFLLSGSAWDGAMPAGFLLSGAEVGEDAGYGPVRTISAEEVRQVSEHLATLPDRFIQESWDFSALHEAEIYPSIWDRNDHEDIEYTAEFFAVLREFMSTAATNGEAVALVIM